jgi:hypothetical protein
MYFIRHYFMTATPLNGITFQAALAKDVKTDLETTLGILSGKGKGVKGKGPRGSERKKMWEEVKALRKEYGGTHGHPNTVPNADLVT